jgi:hypothetical protein
MRVATATDLGRGPTPDEPTLSGFNNASAAQSRLQLHVSCFEVHDNAVYDLLQPTRVEALLKDEGGGGATECGLVRLRVKRLSHATKLLQRRLPVTNSSASTLIVRLYLTRETARGSAMYVAVIANGAELQWAAAVHGCVRERYRER